MTDGSLKLIETDRISRSYSEMTSTLPWHKSVIAFCQCTTLSGSYVAFKRSVCSIAISFCPVALNSVKTPIHRKTLLDIRLTRSSVLVITPTDSLLRTLRALSALSGFLERRHPYTGATESVGRPLPPQSSP